MVQAEEPFRASSAAMGGVPGTFDGEGVTFSDAAMSSDREFVGASSCLTESADSASAGSASEEGLLG
ncbi:hypothetical protein [Streptomyces tsukubensis]|uniref:hypothetical protein n=1 Tax=Streptomyces tsukubensis TaxID=83656 RepID=UPI00269FDF52